MINEVNYIDQIKNYSSYLSALRKAYDSVTETRNLRGGRFRLHYITDFSEVVGFCFPFKKIHGLETGDWETPHRLRLRERLALWNLFGRYGKLIILPPHRLELHNYVRRLREELRRGISRREDISDFRARILSAEKIIELRQLIQKWESTKMLSATERMAISDFIQDNYLELEVLRTIGNLNGLDTLRALIRNQSVVFVEDFIDLRIEEQEVKKGARVWYPDILRNRHAEEKEYASYLDAIACFFLEKINAVLIPRGEFAMLVSRSKALLKVLDETGRVNLLLNHQKDLQTNSGSELQEHKFSVTRNLDSILAESLIENLEAKGAGLSSQFESNLKTVLTTYEAAKGSMSNDEEKLKNVIESIQELYETMIRIDNYDLFRIPDDRGNVRLKYLEDTGIVNTMRVLKAIVESDDQLSEEIETRQMRLNEELKRLTSKLRNRFEKVRRIPQIDDLHRITVNEVNLGAGSVFFRGIHGEMPTRIAFQNPRVLSLAKDLFEEMKDPNSLDVISEYLTRINDAKQNDMFNEELQEYNLLYAYMEILVGNYEAALKRLADAIPRTKGKAKLEMYYLTAFISRKKEYTVRGIESCVKGLKLSISREPRILREKGVLVWQAQRSKNSRTILEVNRLLNQSPTLTLSIQLTREALENTTEEDEILKYQCLNGLAYLYAESGEPDEIKAALGYFKQLKKEFPDQRGWPSRFFDTRGFIDFRAAQTGAFVGPRTIKLLEAAIASFDIALERGGIMGQELLTVSQHRHDAKTLLYSIRDQ